MATEHKIPEQLIARAAAAAKSIRKGLLLLDRLSHRVIPFEWADGFIDLSYRQGMADVRCATRKCGHIFTLEFPENMLELAKTDAWEHNENLTLRERRGLARAMDLCLSRLEEAKWAMHKNLPVCADCGKNISAEITGYLSGECFSEDNFRYVYAACEIHPLINEHGHYEENLGAAFLLTEIIRHRERLADHPGKNGSGNGGMEM